MMKRFVASLLALALEAGEVRAEVWKCSDGRRSVYTNAPSSKECTSESYRHGSFTKVPAEAFESFKPLLVPSDELAVDSKLAKPVLSVEHAERRKDESIFCQVRGNIEGKGGERVRIELRRGGATTTEQEVVISPRKKRASFSANLPGPCRDLKARVIGVRS